MKDFFLSSFFKIYFFAEMTERYRQRRCRHRRQSRRRRRWRRRRWWKSAAAATEPGAKFTQSVNKRTWKKM